MEELSFLYFVILPFVMVAGIVEGLWQSRTRAERYDWKAWACSLADLLGRRVLAFIPYTLAAPWLGWVWEHRLFTQSLDNAWSVLLLFVGLEFCYYWYHRDQPHLALVLGGALGAPFAQSAQPRRRLSAGLVRQVHRNARSSSRRWSLLGFTPTVVLSALFLNLLYQFWLHADWIPRLGWLEYVFNTPSSHRVHHARNPEYLDANYGGVLIVFDRLFGSYIAERADVPLRLRADLAIPSRRTTSWWSTSSRGSASSRTCARRARCAKSGCICSPRRAGAPTAKA